MLFRSVPSIIKGTVTAPRISNVAGAYFLDNISDFLNYSGCRVRLKDSANKYFDVVLGARGTSEGLGNNVLTSWISGINYETWTTSGANITWIINRGII
jgi:hypothetical protein